MPPEDGLWSEKHLGILFVGFPQEQMKWFFCIHQTQDSADTKRCPVPDVQRVCAGPLQSPVCGNPLDCVLLSIMQNLHQMFYAEFKMFNLFPYLCGHGCAKATAHLWRPGDNL